MHTELVIFDLDGVIADTEPLHREAKLRIMRKFNLTNSVDLDKHIGHPNSELWSVVIDENGVDMTPEQLERMQYDHILDQLVENDTQLSKGLPELFRYLDEHHIRKALSSSSDRYYVDKMLTYFSLTDVFAAVVGGSEVKRKKPAPDGYRLVLDRAGVDHARAIAIEDTSSGVQAAVAAELRCLGYRNPTSGNQDLSLTIAQFDSLTEIPAWLERNI